MFSEGQIIVQRGLHPDGRISATRPVMVLPGSPTPGQSAGSLAAVRSGTSHGAQLASATALNRHRLLLQGTGQLDDVQAWPWRGCRRSARRSFSRHGR